MFEFHWPWAAVLAPLPWLLRIASRRFRAVSPATPPPAPLEEQRVTLRHPRLADLSRTYQARTPGRPLASRLYPVLLGLLWLALVLVLMRPQWLESHTEVSRPGYDLMLSVDASHSMNAIDFSIDERQVTRMAVVKGVMGRFIEQREGDRIGLIVFGTQAFLLSPLSLDRAAVRLILDGIEPSIAGPATALGDGIALGVRALRDRPEGSRVMIVIADGDNNAGQFSPGEAASLAQHEGVRVYVIGVGTVAEQIPIIEGGRLRYRDDLAMDETVLKRIVETTGGAYFRATDTAGLEAISREIDRLEKTQAEARTVLLPRPLYRWPLGVALLILLVLGLFPGGRRRVLRSPANA
ncbi:VWA domain-containing protein [Thioalkalicoccus limnaeus]|uniref:VWA domain-containing protein n=1 Tax=Thioalkalicoccus limnaeus TaxID=120681 RepID=A0ABV4BBB0_9GAMM